MKQVWKAAAFCMAAASILAAAGCGGVQKAPAASGNNAPAVQAIKDKGVLVVGTSVDFPPYEFVDKSSGREDIVGVDVALAQKIADKLGVRLVVQNVDFSILSSEITKGKIDMAIAGLNPSKERQSRLLFSKPYMDTRQTLLVRAKEAASYRSLDDFKGKTIGAQRGSIQEQLARTRVPDASIKAYNQIDDLLDALKEGNVDAVVYETVGAKPYLLMNPALTDSGIYFDKVDGTSAVGVGKKNEALIAVINEVIDENQKNIPAWIDEYSQLAVKNVKK